jgi:hypothetical protein
MVKKAGLAVIGLILAASCMGADGTGKDAAASSASSGNRASGDDRELFEFEGMIGVPRALLGAAGAIRGVNGAGAPWVIARGKGEVQADGTLEIDVRGLVFDPNDAANVAAGRANTNTVATMRGILSCITLVNGVQAVVNVTTDPFPATLGPVDQGGGDVHIEQVLDVPRPCFAPIVFVTSPAGAWFAVTGF